MSAFSVECPAHTVISVDAIATNTEKAIFDVGIIPSTVSINTYCQNSAFTDPDNCSSYVDSAAIR